MDMHMPANHANHIYRDYGDELNEGHAFAQGAHQANPGYVDEQAMMNRVIEESLKQQQNNHLGSAEEDEQM